MPFDLGFTRSDLWRGTILATIAHGIFTAGHPELAHEQSWDPPNYNLQDSQGSLGTITFGQEGTVGIFFDLHSPRNPLSIEAAYDLDERLAEMPAPLRALANEEALQYVLQDYRGENIPLITAALWSEDDRLIAAEPWSSVLSNGGHLIQSHLRPTEEAVSEWRTQYGFNPAQVELLRSLFDRKLPPGNRPVVLAATEMGVLLEGGAEGLELSRDLMAQVGITVP
jgi:hypothetical protein